jgi:hypothetical protein
MMHSATMASVPIRTITLDMRSVISRKYPMLEIPAEAYNYIVELEAKIDRLRKALERISSGGDDLVLSSGDMMEIADRALESTSSGA